MFIQYKKATNEVTGFQTFPADHCALPTGIPDGGDAADELATAQIDDANAEALQVAANDGVTLYFIDGQLQ